MYNTFKIFFLFPFFCLFVLPFTDIPKDRYIWNKQSGQRGELKGSDSNEV